jgi:hypothetical protein
MENFQTISIVKGSYKAELTWESDGFWGPFLPNLDDKDDEPMLKFRLFHKEKSWRCIHEFVSWLRLTDNPVVLSRCLIKLLDHVIKNEAKINNLIFLNSMKEMHISNGKPKLFLPRD